MKTLQDPQVITGDAANELLSQIFKTVDKEAMMEQAAIDYMFHVYGAAFEGLSLEDVDRKVYQFMPMWFFDNISKIRQARYQASKIELAWKKYCINICEIVLAHAEETFEEETYSLSSLETLMWYCENTNLIKVILVYFNNDVSVNPILNITDEYQYMMYKIFKQKVKRNKDG